MPAHQRLLVVQRDRERGGGFGCAPVARRDGDVAQQAAALGALTGEPLKRALNSSCVIVTHSMSDGPSSPSRTKKAGSRVICTNLGAFLGDVSTFPFHDPALDRTTDGAREP